MGIIFSWKVLSKQSRKNDIDTSYMNLRGGVNQMWIIFNLKVLSKYWKTK